MARDSSRDGPPPEPDPDGAPGEPEPPKDRGSGRGALDETLASGSLPDAVPCPFCESLDTHQFAVFGGQASTAQYYCDGCRTVFEALRWR